MKETDEPEPRHQVLEDREQTVERPFSYEREGFRSTLAYVAAFQDALASEYLDRWRASGGAKDTIRQDLDSFERWRFGAELEAAAHGILLYAVLLRAFPDDLRFKRSRVTAPRNTTPAWTPGAFQGKAPRVGQPEAEAMPETVVTEDEFAKRKWELQQQAHEKGEGGEP